jgi:protein gp37
MAGQTKIEWADSTFNAWIGCTKVGPGCEHCYAEVRDARFVPKEDPARGTAPHWGPHADRSLTKSWGAPVKWQKEAAAFYAEHGRRRRVFCSSLADVFDNHRSILPYWRVALGELVMATPDLEWLFLTKRIGNVLGYLMKMFPNGVPDNVRIGATIVNMEEWSRDHRKIAAVRVACKLKPFLSIEPLLGPINLECDPTWKRWIGWVIVGGESGKEARPMDPRDATAIRDQCERGQVPFLFKQWGEWAPAEGEIQPGDRMLMTWPAGTDGFVREGVRVRNIGKKKAGRSLYGVEHNGFPA